MFNKSNLFLVILSMLAISSAHAHASSSSNATQCVAGARGELKLSIRDFRTAVKTADKPYYAYENQEVPLTLLKKQVEFSVMNNVITNLEVQYFMLRDPEKVGAFSLIGEELKSPEAFYYRGQPNGLTLTFLNEAPGVAFMKIDSQKLLTRARAVHAVIENGQYIVFRCRELAD